MFIVKVYFDKIKQLDNTSYMDADCPQWVLHLQNYIKKQWNWMIFQFFLPPPRMSLCKYLVKKRNNYNLRKNKRIFFVLKPSEQTTVTKHNSNKMLLLCQNTQYKLLIANQKNKNPWFIVTSYFHHSLGNFYFKHSTEIDCCDIKANDKYAAFKCHLITFNKKTSWLVWNTTVGWIQLRKETSK